MADTKTPDATIQTLSGHHSKKIQDHYRYFVYESKRLKVDLVFSLHFFFNDTATTEIYTLSLHDALPISTSPTAAGRKAASAACRRFRLISRSEEHTSELQSHLNLVCRLLLEKKKQN